MADPWAIVVVTQVSGSGRLPVVPSGPLCLVSCAFLFVAQIPGAVSCPVSPGVTLVTRSLVISFGCFLFVAVSC